MSTMKHKSSGRFSVTRLLTLGFFISCSSVVSAQQSGSVSAAVGQSIPTQVAVEYATIGGTALSIQVLGLDRPGTGGSGQIASNQQVGNRNTSVIDQSGAGNNASLRISGNDNRAGITQVGRNNSGQGVLSGNAIQFDLRQDGSGNQADLSVNAPSGSNVVVQQNGSNNSVTGSVPGSINVAVTQVGNGATADVSQSGIPKNINILQFRAR